MNHTRLVLYQIIKFRAKDRYTLCFWKHSTHWLSSHTIQCCLEANGQQNWASQGIGLSLWQEMEWDVKKLCKWKTGEGIMSLLKLDSMENVWACHQPLSVLVSSNLVYSLQCPCIMTNDPKALGLIFFTVFSKHSISQIESNELILQILTCVLLIHSGFGTWIPGYRSQSAIFFSSFFSSLICLFLHPSIYLFT